MLPRNWIKILTSRIGNGLSGIVEPSKIRQPRGDLVRNHRNAFRLAVCLQTALQHPALGCCDDASRRVAEGVRENNGICERSPEDATLTNTLVISLAIQVILRVPHVTAQLIAHENVSTMHTRGLGSGFNDPVSNQTIEVITNV